MNEKQFNQRVVHPLQSWQWGEFRQKTGVKVIREKNFQVTVHPLAKLPYSIIYFPKGPAPNPAMLKTLTRIGKQEKAILIKMEPDLSWPAEQKKPSFILKTEKMLSAHHCRPGRALFTPYTFQMDLSKTEKELLDQMKAKTRYNLRLAQKRGVKIVKDNSKKALAIYLKLTQETTQRQGFYAHTPEYHRLMWQTLAPTGLYHLFLASFKNQPLAAYVFFTFKKRLFYPYGASTRAHREVMAPYALFWEAIKFGQKNNCLLFDMWGSLGPEPDPQDPWFGFHRFKQGFGGTLVKFIGTWDLVLNPKLYPCYNLANALRWQLLRLKKR